MEKTVGRAMALTFMLAAVWLVLASQSAEAGHGTFAAGDVFVSLKSGQVQWRHPDGTLNATLVGFVPGHAEGMGFDASGNLYVTHWCADTTCLTGNNVEKWSPSAMSLGTFGTGYNCNPNSIVFDSSGNAYVGQADCAADILEFNAAGGAPLDSFDAAVENRGTNWIDLDGSGCFVFYTSEAFNVKRYNVCAGPYGQLADFNTASLPGEGHALRILPDGGVLVAATTVIARLDADGNLVQTYDVLGEPELWVGLDIVGDGTFWASNMHSSNVYKFDLATGAVLASFNAGIGTTVKGVAVKRAPTLVMWGRMTGGGSIFTGASDLGAPPGTRITHGFQLHCNKNREPNNLEINIHGVVGSRFHLLELTFAHCTDDPSIDPNPPAAPFDTYEGKGTGRYNGVPGATAEWIFTDAGEPGVNDRIKRLIIRDAGGIVVLSIPEPGHTLTFGNHQAHK